MNYGMRKLCKSLKYDKYTIMNFTIVLDINPYVRLWIANGWQFVDGYECNIHIPFYLKPYVWHLIKKYQFSKWYDKQFK